MTEPLAFMFSRCRRMSLAMLAALSCLTIAVDPAAVAASADQAADRISYVLLAPGSRSSTMSGSMEDLRRAKTLRAGREGLLYVRQGGASYVIRDAETLRRAQSIFEPQEALGARQAQLGSRRAELGKRQAQLGAQQGRLGLQQAGASPARAAELGRRQDALGRQQNLLGQRQSALGAQQDALGREQSRLARLADAKFQALLAEAIRRGVAQRID